MITLATLPEATEQEVFDQVTTHLLTQKKQARNDVGYTYHLGDTRCAAGCLISTDEYRSNFEMVGWEDLVTAGVVPHQHAPLIVALQQIHDGTTPEYWETKLRDIACNYDLHFNWPQ